ncbi:protein cholesin-like isoform X2 [Mobula birostris]|uniref:protein cholesin-like isoform X2 n=1 Tax=Mobula birostris TaxID=1983395 RepID=UPI003B28521B
MTSLCSPSHFRILWTRSESSWTLAPGRQITILVSFLCPQNHLSVPLTYRVPYYRCRPLLFPTLLSHRARLSSRGTATVAFPRWSEKHKEWRFQKIRQTWLLQHMYDCDQISDEHFTLLLGYLEGLKGNARDLTIQKTEALIKESDATDDPTVFSQKKIERMRQVLQILS